MKQLLILIFLSACGESEVDFTTQHGFYVYKAQNGQHLKPEVIDSGFSLLVYEYLGLDSHSLYLSPLNIYFVEEYMGCLNFSCLDGNRYYRENAVIIFADPSSANMAFDMEHEFGHYVSFLFNEEDNDLYHFNMSLWQSVDRSYYKLLSSFQLK